MRADIMFQLCYIKRSEAESAPQRERERERLIQSPQYVTEQRGWWWSREGCRQGVGEEKGTQCAVCTTLEIKC